MKAKTIKETSKVIADMVWDALVGMSALTPGNQKAWEVIEEETRVRLCLLGDKEEKDAYLDGWTDGNAHKAYPPAEHKAAIEKDWEESTTKLLIDGGKKDESFR